MTREEALRLAWAAQPQREVDLTPLREAFLASGLEPREVARALGWLDRGKADGRRVRRVLGCAEYNLGGGRGWGVRKTCTYSTGVRLAEAIGVDPVDVGL